MAHKTAPTGQHWKSTENDRNPLKKYSSSPCTSLFFKIALYYLNPGQWLTEFCQENTRVIANTFFQQHKRRLYTWTLPDSQHRNQIDYILCSQRWRRSIQSAKTRWGANCGSDHELLIAKFRLKVKKVGKTTRPIRYDLNQIPYDYAVEMRKRFKGRDLIDRVPDELWIGSWHCTGDRNQDHPQ